MLGDRGVVIIGSGPAGISAALSLRDVGIPSLVVERAAQVAAAWRGRYDRLKLNTGRQFSHLPGRGYPKGTPVYPSRDQVVEHFERHARAPGVELRVNTEVKRINRESSGWLVSTSDGEIKARHVVIATGYQHTHRSYRTGRAASPVSYRTRAATAIRRRTRVSECSWSVRDRRGWKSPTT
ncbi:hypothetical protein MSTO_20010 [Mycobacterium stomatepiae]|uniref:Monooxygenase n=1 Tax=Mycobacterium stomatepiae TaxID=470076 RepID=A0A7I7Q6Z6_9MYCO|nr:hypothetical protein MSTO_20010 [Mycobacterium stomatepiae]